MKQIEMQDLTIPPIAIALGLGEKDHLGVNLFLVLVMELKN